MSKRKKNHEDLRSCEGIKVVWGRAGAACWWGAGEHSGAVDLLAGWPPPYKPLPSRLMCFSITRKPIIIKRNLSWGPAAASRPRLPPPSRGPYQHRYQILTIDSIMELENTTPKCLFLRPRLQVRTPSCLIPGISGEGRTRCLEERDNKRGKKIMVECGGKKVGKM